MVTEDLTSAPAGVAPEGAAQTAPRSQNGRSGHEKSREVRLGIVMYGGVSLAVYIYGVAHELFRTVHGNGVYRLLKALTDSDIVVDVVSGTSAGGINGIMLSYALCNRRNFADAAALWREHGDIRNLLRSPDTPTDQCVSLLNSEGFYQPRLEEAFRNMRAYIPEDGEDLSEFDELDLFVTGTDVDGTISTRVDDAGHLVTVKDHRSVFLLKHRKNRKQPFAASEYTDPDILYRALAKLGRITSCFPAAFAPVYVANEQPGNTSDDALLQLWGQLGKDACFLDGGVLDNKPFSYTTGAIFSRSADREVDRKLLYVEPDPEVFRQPGKATQPNIVQAVLSSLIGIPGYESISNDLKQISDRNSKLKQYRRLVSTLHKTIIETPQERRLQQADRELYTRCRLVHLSDRVIDGLFGVNGTAQQIEPRHYKRAAELVQAFDSMKLDTDRLFADLDIDFRLRRLHRVVSFLYDRLGLQDLQDSSSDDLTQRYRALRAAFNRQIKLYEIVRSAMEGLLDDAPIQWREMSNDEVWTTVESALYALLGDDHGPASSITDTDLEVFLGNTATQWLPQRQLSALNTAFYDRIAAVVAELRRNTLPEAAQRTSAIRRFEQYEQAILHHFLPDADDPVRQAYDHFEDLDARLFPIELAGDLHEKDILEIVRISPRDAQRAFSRNGLSDKVSGDSVYHFGAFFKRSWRSNDILWGRLDAACQLTELLFDVDRIRRLLDNADQRARLRTRFFGSSLNTALDPATLFPHAGATTHNRLRTWLTALLSDDPSQREEALDATVLEEILTLLVEAEQLEIINKELPNVITDAVVEQSEWNMFQIQMEQHAAPSNGSANGRASATANGTPSNGKATDDSVHIQAAPWVFRPPQGRIDRLLASSFAALTVKDAMSSFSHPGSASPSRPSDTMLGRFFRQSYRVGSESLTRDIPTIVLFELIVTALLVVRNCIINVFGDRGERIRSNIFYRLGIDYPLRILHAFVLFVRRYPDRRSSLFIGIGAISVLALAVGVVWYEEIIGWGAAFSLTSLIIFIIAPVVVLLAEIVILRKFSRSPASGSAQRS